MKMKAQSLAAAATTLQPSAKKPKIEQQTCDPSDEPTVALNAVWIRFDGYLMTESDKNILTSGDLLNDNHINSAQCLLSHQFPLAEGLRYTILQTKKRGKKIRNGLQIIHDRGNHWLVASTIGCSDGVVEVYDSLYNSVDEGTKTVIQNLFEIPENYETIVINTQKQVGGKDCGVFAIAIATAILSGCKLDSIKFLQVEMRSHLLHCFNSKEMLAFPSQTYH